MREFELQRRIIMAFSWAGDLTGCLPVKKYFQIAADLYQGQLLRWDADAGGAVEPIIAAADAGPDVTSMIAGICTGIVTSPSFNATYKGDFGDLDTTQALQVLNDPIGPTLAEVTLITPTTLVKCPIVHGTIGTNPERKACTTGSTDGLSFIVGTINDTVSNFSTAYCSSGANAGIYRKITTGAAATQTVLLSFPYDIAVGDTFCIANVTEGVAHIDFDTQMQGIDSSAALTNYFIVYVHELNLAEAGKEYAVFTISSRHLL
jgi:hypothetical protein